MRQTLNAKVVGAIAERYMVNPIVLHIGTPPPTDPPGHPALLPFPYDITLHEGPNKYLSLLFFAGEWRHECGSAIGQSTTVVVDTSLKRIISWKLLPAYIQNHVQTLIYTRRVKVHPDLRLFPGVTNIIFWTTVREWTPEQVSMAASDLDLELLYDPKDKKSAKKLETDKLERYNELLRLAMLEVEQHVEKSLLTPDKVRKVLRLWALPKKIANPVDDLVEGAVSHALNHSNLELT
jgi:hypothetical protein